MDLPVERDDVIARWPALAAITDDERWAAALDDAALIVPEETWGRRCALARCHVAAHFIALGNPSVRESGPVSSESVGGVSRSYAVRPPPDGYQWNATPYGTAYLLLLRQLGLFATVA